jgi:glycosyltransferase involved in cell wall biosynthesis
MKILQLIPQFILPATDGGKIGILNIIKEFSKYAKVELIVFCNENPEDIYLQELKQYGNVNLIVKDVSNSLYNILNSILINRPVYLSKFYDNFVLSIIDNLLESLEFDVIHADHTSMAQIAEYISIKTNKPWGFRLHNIENMIWKRFAKDLPFYDLKKYLINYQSKLLYKDEAKLISKANVAFPITNEDRRIANIMSPDSNLVVASAGVDYLSIFRKQVERNRNTLAIATNYHWIHNVNGIIWFIEEVLTKLKELNEDVKFKLYGKNIPKVFDNYRHLGVEPIGFVEDLSEELSKAQIYIAPLFVGSGIRIKILEAMAYELPVVATKVSAEGINASQEDGLFVSDSAEVQVRLISNLLNEDINQIGTNARKYIIENYSWEKNVGVMINEYQKL